MWQGTRRSFLQAGAGIALTSLGMRGRAEWSQTAGERPPQADGVRILDPQMRIPVSLIIDDSTCLANLAHFAMPQFAQTWPDDNAFKKPWQKTPREIPDDFVRKFGEWCGERGIKGKYSVVPYPACIGWVDRFLPGWTARQLAESLKLVRELLMPGWDITPEMISHTRVINTKTGRPYEDSSPRFMENWQWSDNRSTDELADYISYALHILKNAGLPCEGVTSPGTFGAGARPRYARAVLQACRDVFRVEIPHYFLDVITDDRSVAPRVECASGLDGPDPQCVVSIVACTEDWFGDWDGLKAGSPDLMIDKDLQRGRLIDVIARGEPAVLACHWPGMYYNGDEVGFNVFKEVVHRLNTRYDHLIWMTLSEIARYWAARELTRIDRDSNGIAILAPFATARYTIRVAARGDAVPQLVLDDKPQPLREVSKPLDLRPGVWMRDKAGMVVCFDLPKGRSRLHIR